MWRRIFNFAAAASLGLCLVILALCLHSMGRSDWGVRIERRYPGGTWEAGTLFGDFHWKVTPDEPPGVRATAPPNVSVSMGSMSLRGRPMPGVVWSEHRDVRVVGAGPAVQWVTRWDGRVDGWLAILVTLVLPAAWWGARRRRARRTREALAAGRCPKCGYDLRGTPGGCPECGWGRTDKADA